MNLTQMRSRLRVDLHDEDSNAYRWTDAQLDRHLVHAALELSAGQPHVAAATLPTGSDGRTVSLATLSSLVSVEAVEFPVGENPPSYLDFTQRGDELALLSDDPPGPAVSVKVFYGKMHTLDATTSTIPPQLEELVLAGAAGYAAMDLSVDAINSINAGGPNAWRHFLIWGQEKLVHFRLGLTGLSRPSLRVRRLYTPTDGGR